MNAGVQKALDNVDMVYDDLVVIANDIYNGCLEEIDKLVNSVYDNIENLSNDDLRNLILRISLKAYSFSEIKEKSAFKSTLAETLRKEAYARAFGAAEGTAGAKDNIATLQVSSELLTEEIYDVVASLFKVKLDELHRVTDSLKTVLTSRLSEAKLAQMEVPQ